MKSCSHWEKKYPKAGYCSVCFLWCFGKPASWWTNKPLWIHDVTFVLCTLLFSTAMTKVCFQQRTWNCSFRRLLETAEVLQDILRGGKIIQSVLVEHIFHLYRMKKNPKQFLWLLQFPCQYQPNRGLYFISSWLSALNVAVLVVHCDTFVLFCYRRRHRIRVMVHFVPLMPCWESPDWITLKKRKISNGIFISLWEKLWKSDGWS